jgi:hypothetical protein
VAPLVFKTSLGVVRLPEGSTPSLLRQDDDIESHKKVASSHLLRRSLGGIASVLYALSAAGSKEDGALGGLWSRFFSVYDPSASIPHPSRIAPVPSCTKK